MLKISACVITKNEEKNIGRWLDCMRQLADEMIVVDTGSTDATVELAQAAGAKVCHFSWCDDFAAAKNFALEQATGEWIVFADADEYFADPPAVRHFLASDAAMKTAVDAWLVTIVNLDMDHQQQEIQRFANVRIFPRCPELRYAGRVHEMLQRAGQEPVLGMAPAEVLLYHTGYSAGSVQQKLRRNLALLQADIAERDKQDSERAISPLRQAEDALLLDTSDMGISEVTERILQLVQERAQ